MRVAFFSRWSCTAPVRVACWLIALVFSTTSAACVVLPLRKPSVRTPTSETTLKGTVDLHFVKEGVTPAIEVRQQIGHLAVYETPQLFVARWLDSQWAVFMAGVSPAGGGGGTARRWDAHTAFISLNDASVVREIHVVSEDDMLTAIRTRALTEQAALPNTRISAAVTRTERGFVGKLGVGWPGELTFGEDGVSFHQDDKKEHEFQTSLVNVESLQLHRMVLAGSEPPVNEFNVSLHFREKTAAGGFVECYISFAQLVQLVRVADTVDVPFQYSRTLGVNIGDS